MYPGGKENPFFISLPDDVPLTRSTYSLIVNPSPSPNLFYSVAITQPTKHLQVRDRIEKPSPKGAEYIDEAVTVG